MTGASENPETTTMRASAGLAKVIADKLEQPDLDNRSYRVIQLGNKLEALVVHDPDTDKASAAMDVHVGNFSDDDDLQGQAHAVEHLLFMGTEKYPKENEYSQYLSEHSGYSNAYTASTSTNYYFEVGHEHFHGALDRFAQFFIAPLFLEETLDRELKAVDSENKKNLQSDTWRLHQLWKSLSNPKHPYCHFSTGNLETLKELPAKRGINVREEFMKFHDKYYSANTMKLVVLGREDLDTLEKWTVDLFSGVKNKDIPDPRFEGQPYGPEQLMTQVFAKPVMDTRLLELTFPFMDEELMYRTHPSRYASHLIGHEGPGSILAYLKKKGWANSLSAGASHVTNDAAFFMVSIKLTPEGLAEYLEVVNVVFAYINLIKDIPPQEWIVDELRGTAAVDFKFREKSMASKFTSRFAATMQKPLPRKWLLSGTSLIREFDPELITKSLSYLRPDNVRITVVARGCPIGTFNKKEKWYGTEYRVEPIHPYFMIRLKGTCKKGTGAGPYLEKELHLPHKNEFIPTNFNVQKTEVETPAKCPVLIRNTDLARIWFKKDDTFWVPKANVYMTFRNPLLYATPGNMVAGRIYCDLVKDALGEYAYDAEIAGLQYDISHSSIGLEIELSGYNDKMSVLLEKVVTIMRDHEISPDRFQIIRERALRAYKNWKFEAPYLQVGQFTRYLTYPIMWINEDVVPELEVLTVEDVKNLYPKILKTTYIEALVHGNLYKEDALKCVDLVEKILQPRPLSPAQHPVRRSLIPPRGDRIVWTRSLEDPKNINNCIEYTLYVGESRDRRLKMLLTLFAQLSEEPCFDQLRTKEQLGYIVFSGPRFSATTMSYRVIVQSERTAPYLESRIEKYLADFAKKLHEYTDKEFQSHVKAVILEKTERLKNLHQESNRLWIHIKHEFFDFEQIDADVAELKQLTKKDVIKFYDEYISPASLTRSKASIQMHSTAKKDEKAILIKGLIGFLSLSSGVVAESAELASALENVDLKNTDALTNAVEGFLKQRNVEDAKVTGVMAAGKELLKTFKPEDFGEVLTDATAWKSACAVTAAAGPVKPLGEYEELTSRL